MTTHFDLDGLDSGTVALIGVPLDENSSFLRGPMLAPPRIREALYGGSANLCAENGLDLGENPGWHDVGDLTLSSGEQARRKIQSAIAALLVSLAVSRPGMCSTSFSNLMLTWLAPTSWN